MDFLAVLVLAVGLAMDAFAVSVCKGLAMKKVVLRSALIVGVWFGFFQGFMPLVGYFLGSSLYSYISDYDHWIAFVLLALIGINMIREAFSEEDEGIDDDIGLRTMFVLAVATSIDALAVGITLAMTGDGIASSALTIGVVTLVLSAIGVAIGGRIGDRFGKKAELVGGAILILIGAKILLEHLGFL